MPLIDFRGRHSSLYLSREGKNYIMLVNDNAPSADLCYQPVAGQHRLHVDTKGLNLDYLHLVDRLTGTDIDLLATPDYGFESSIGDFSMRFRLVFDPNETMESEDIFAYVSNGRIILTGITGPYELQVIDMTGRIIDTLTPGVYVLRLITPERVRIQKIVIPN